jgi:hypothetical protein
MGISILLGNGDGSFQNPVLYPAGTNSRVGIVADFNSDGNLDLAVANYTDNDVSILLGNGDGSFRAPLNYPVGANPNALKGADVNGDGKLDLITANQGSNSVSVLLGNGDGTFHTHTDYPAGLGPSDVAVGDFNADGRLDLAIADNSGARASILLQAPTISFSQTALTFADQLIGISSAAQTVTVTNAGYLTLKITAVTITGTDATDFIETNTCPASLSPGVHCTISVTFMPTHIGPRAASVSITDTAAGRPQTIALSGAGVVSGPNATLSATSLTFANQLLNTTSSAQSITLNNYGTVALSPSITIKGTDLGDFAQTNTCGSSVAAGASCTIKMWFKPKGINKRTATLLIADNAPGSPQAVSLSGTGTEVKLNPRSLHFSCTIGAHLPPCSAPPQTTTLTNTGTTVLSIAGITIRGPFSQTNNCDSSVGAGKSCTITVKWSRVTGTGALSISDNGGGSPQQVPLSAKIHVIVCFKHCGAPVLGALPVRSALAAHSSVAAPIPTGPIPVGTRTLDLVDSRHDDPYLAQA